MIHVTSFKTGLLKSSFFNIIFQDITVKFCLGKLWKYPDIMSEHLILYQGLKGALLLFVSLNMSILQDQIVCLKVTKFLFFDYLYKPLIFLIETWQFLAQRVI
jgi:hypothetical protein